MAYYKDVVRATREVLAQYTTRLTVRQVYYRLVSPPYQIIPNTSSSYTTFVSQLVKAREKGEVPWTRFVDSARRTIGGDHGYKTIVEFIEARLDYLAKDYYTKPLWATQPKTVEVWVEKEALAEVINEASSPYRTVVFPSRGYSSLTMLMEAVQRWDWRDNPIVILDFRDHDPSGLDMSRDIKSRLSRYGAKSLTIKRIALTHDQARSLPSNPTKRVDPRSRDYVALYGNECWELDALPPDELQRLVRGAIEGELDVRLWNETIAQINVDKEKIEKALLTSLPNFKKELAKKLSKGD